MAKRNWLDGFIGFFSPRSEARRLRSKYVAEVMGAQLRKYDGAGAGRRQKGYGGAATSANSETRAAAKVLRNRARDMVRNDPYAARFIQLVASNTIGAGIMSQVKTENSTELNELWVRWTRSTDIDYDGRNDFAGLQRLVMETVALSGECLVRTRRFRSRTKLIVPMQLQVLEPDFLDTTQEQLSPAKDGTFTVQGIKFDKNGKRLGYFILKDHPGGALRTGTNFSSTLSEFVKASEIDHIYRQDRPGQIRGITWLAPVMMKLRDFSDYTDAQIVKQKVSACFTAFVHDMESLQEPGTSDNSSLSEKMEPGQIEVLSPGKDITFASPPSVDGYKEFATQCLHEISAGLGVPYEGLTSDYSDVNFSSSRMAFIQFHKNIDTWRWGIIIPQFCQPTFRRFAEVASLQNIGSAEAAVSWTPPKREFIDPTKEVPALIKSVRAGFTTLSETIRMHGSDPAEHFAELAADNKTVDGLELILDSDPRKTNQTGAAQMDPDASDAPPNSSSE